MRLENSELKAFQAVIEANGFNRAAELLHISQSAVSQSVANLEAKLDIVLIKRGKQPQLTDAGRRVLDYAKEMIREEQQVLEDIDRIKDGGQQLLSLAVNSTINRFYAPHLISEFCNSQHDTQLKIAELPSRDLIYAVLSNRTELAIGPFQKQMDAFDTIPLFTETRHLVVSPDHAHGQQMISGNSQYLRQTPLITSSLDNPQMRPAIQRIRDKFKSVWEVSSLSMRIHLVDQGLGVAFIDNKLLTDHPVCRQFNTMTGTSYSTINRQVGLYYKKGKTLTDAASQFVELCRAFWH